MALSLPPHPTQQQHRLAGGAEGGPTIKREMRAELSSPACVSDIAFSGCRPRLESSLPLPLPPTPLESHPLPIGHGQAGEDRWAS